eukprot:1161097-Pelagomonas_calceolata.AAC.2
MQLHLNPPTPLTTTKAAASIAACVHTIICRASHFPFFRSSYKPSNVYTVEQHFIAFMPCILVREIYGSLSQCVSFSLTDVGGVVTATIGSSALLCYHAKSLPLRDSGAALNCNHSQSLPHTCRGSSRQQAVIRARTPGGQWSGMVGRRLLMATARMICVQAVCDTERTDVCKCRQEGSRVNLLQLITAVRMKLVQIAARPCLSERHFLNARGQTWTASSEPTYVGGQSQT